MTYKQSHLNNIIKRTFRLIPFLNLLISYKEQSDISTLSLTISYEEHSDIYQVPIE